MTSAKNDFAGADLAGVSLEGVDLRGADLSDTSGLTAAQLAGADLSGAKLPASLAGFDGLARSADLSKNAAHTFTFLVFSCLYSWVTVATTTDARLLTSFISSPLPVIGTPIPLYLFYIVAPFIVTALYLYLHLELQSLWEELAQLPAVFPDGRTLTRKVSPSFLTALVQQFERRARGARPRVLEMLIAWSGAWLLGPITLLIFWVRYLPRHDLAGSLTQVGLMSLAAAVGAWSHRHTFALSSRSRRTPAPVAAAAFGIVVAVAFAVLSYGAVEGVDDAAENRRTPARADATPFVRTTVPRLLAALHVRAFADMQDAAVSERPSNWASGPAPGIMPLTGDRPNGEDTISEDVVRSVVGAELRGKQLRYVNARGAFLVRADLTHASLRGADLSYVSMQRATLEESELSLAYIANSHLEGANFKNADLRNVYLGDSRVEGGDFRAADMTGAILVGTDLRQARLDFARLDGVMFSQSDLQGARLDWASLCGADLGSAKNLTQAQLEFAFTDAATVLPAGLHGGGRLCKGSSVPPSAASSACPAPAVTVPELRDGVYKLVLRSGAGTCSTELWPAGAPDNATMQQLDHPPLASAQFRAAVVGHFFTLTPAPTGAPRDTEVVNIPPGDGRSGYFKVSFIAPRGFSSVSLTGRANADDAGRVFVNGTPISPSLLSPDAIREFADIPFSTRDARLFRPGAVNEILVSDVNAGGGPGGAAFYFELTFRK